MYIKLLKKYKNNNPGKIMSVSNKLAEELIVMKIADDVTSRDFLFKTNFGETKAFNLSPQTK